MQLTSVSGEHPGVGGGVGAQIRQAVGGLRLEERNVLSCVINKSLAGIAIEIDFIANACQFLRHEAFLQAWHPRVT